MVLEIELRVIGNDADDVFSGCQSSDKLGLVARRHGKVRGAVLRAARAAANAVTRLASSQRGCGHDGDV